MGIFGRFEHNYRRTVRILKVLMRATMSDLSQPSRSPEIPAAEKEFDPIREVQQLRRDLAHRLRELQENHARKPETSLLVGEKKLLRKNATETVASAPSAMTDIAETEETASEINTDSFSRRLQHMKETLSRLQISGKETLYGSTGFSDRQAAGITPSPDTANEFMEPRKKTGIIPQDQADNVEKNRIAGTVKSCCAKTKDVGISNVSVFSETLMREKRPDMLKTQSSMSFDMLDIANVGLTVVGFIGTFVGLGLCLFEEGIVSNPGPVLILAGALLISIGFSGRFFSIFYDRNRVMSKPF